MSLSNSQYNMWRAITALIYSDGHKHPDEEEFLKDAFKKLGMSPEQRQELATDIDQPRNVNEFVPLITEPRDRSQFVYFARLVFWSDGDFSKQEEGIFAQLKSEVMSKVDLTSIMKEVDEVASERLQADAKRPLRERFANAVIFWKEI